ncbi:MAG: hypothetical protein HRT74_10250 [Flavobacteriales bacterium]|nr:hypothetical protein [Flavobacteriales bacterium]
MNYLKSAFHRFFEEFHFYFQLLKNQATKTIIATNHYHQEGLIAACKLLDIRFVEIQHGLMSQNDLYYHYDAKLLPDSNLTQAFFPNDLILYGPFWKKLLSTGAEHRDSSIHIGGDYVYKAKTEKPQLDKENIIFIGAQKNMHEPYLEYLNMLMPMMEAHPNWKVVIKLHPLEKKKELYFAFKHDQLEVVGNESDLMDVLSRCKIQISIYSTTLFDALGMDVVNYSLQNFSESQDYAAEMIQHQVAIPLRIDEDPVAKFTKDPSAQPLKRPDVYAPLNKVVLDSFLQ